MFKFHALKQLTLKGMQFSVWFVKELTLKLRWLIHAFCNGVHSASSTLSASADIDIYSSSSVWIITENGFFDCLCICWESLNELFYREPYMTEKKNVKHNLSIRTAAECYHNRSWVLLIEKKNFSDETFSSTFWTLFNLQKSLFSHFVIRSIVTLKNQ